MCAKGRHSVAAALSIGAALLGSAAPAAASTSVYPAGGSGFDTDAEGWSPGGAACSPATVFCSAEASYERGVGNPPGSIAAKTTATANLVDLFNGTVVWNSPRFAVPIGAVTGARVRLDRAFDPGGLVDVEPKATFEVTLRDVTTGTETVPLRGEVDKGDSTFASRGAPASVVGGHSYRLSVEAVTVQSTLALSALSGTTALWLDNIGLEVTTAGGGKGGGGAFSSRRLRSLLRSAGTTAPVVLVGKRLLVRVSCPRKVGHACQIRARGMLTRKRAATATRGVRVGAGKGRRIVLRVKPWARHKLAQRKRILVRQRVRARGVSATIYQPRKLIRR